MSEEITESAKATQEVAKTTGKAIEAAEKVGRFISRIIGEPLDEISGMFTDKLRFMRWEKRVRFVERVDEIIERRKLRGFRQIAPPKFVLPIIEHASLEEDDELQDMWANLLASSVDPDFNGKIRTAYIDILKELEVVDVHVLDFIYKSRPPSPPQSLPDPFQMLAPVNSSSIINALELGIAAYKTSIDNLIRVRCLASYVESKRIEMSYQDRTFGLQERYEDVSTDHGYSAVRLTSLGIGFVEACIGKTNEN